MRSAVCLLADNLQGISPEWIAQWASIPRYGRIILRYGGQLGMYHIISAISV